MPPKPRRGFSSDEDEDMEEVKPRRKADLKSAPKKKDLKRSPKRSPKKAQPKTSAMTADHLLDGNRNSDSSDDENEKDDADIDNDDLLNLQVPPLPPPCMAADGSGSRLIIRDIIAENFKSYFGRQRIGPFHSNYTSIVGPNGSGKSNVIDSLLFVFGFKASKIRSKKLSVLIHSSAGRDNLQSCSVEVHFQKIIDKDDGELGEFEVVPRSQFVVSRTAFKDNSSKYYLTSHDGTRKTVSFKEVGQKLKDVGIDLKHNRFLILQGEVEQIAMMKPKADDKGNDGMLEYLEDIIGTSRYKEPLSRVEKKISAIGDQISSQSRQLGQATKEKERLEGPVKEMVEIMKIENRMAIVKNQLALKNKLTWTRELAKMEGEELVDAREEKEKAEEAMKGVLEKLKEQKMQSGVLEKEQTKAQADLDRVTTDIGGEEQREQKRKNDLKRVAKDIEKLEENLEKEAKKIVDIEQIPTKSAKKVEAQRKIIEEMNEQERNAQEQLEENQKVYAERTVDDREAKTKCEEQFGTANQKAVALRGEVENLRVELRGLTEKAARSAKQVENTRTVVDNARRTREEKQTELTTAGKELPDKEKELKTNRDRASELREKDDTATREVAGLRSKIAEEQRRVADASGGSRLLKGLMQAKSDGRIPGILGRLGDLGGIDPKYDIAASTSSGAFDSVVVEDVKTSQLCFDLCRQEKLGVVNVIILDKIKYLENNLNAVRNYPENLQRIFDLIDISDPKLRTAFYFAVRETLVANDNDQAQRVAFGRERHRVVSLQGALFDPSGTMSGGGQPLRGKIGKNAKVDTSRDSQKLVNEWRGELAEKERELQEIKTESRDVERSIQTLSDRVKTLQDAVRKLTSDVKNAELTVTAQERNLANFEKQMQVDKGKVDEGKVQELEEKIEQKTQEQQDAQKLADKARAKVAEVDDRLNVVRKELLTLFESEISDARKKRTIAETTLSKEQAAINSAGRNLKKAETRKAEIEKDIEDSRKVLENLENGAETSKGELEKLGERKNKLEQRLKEIEETLKELRKDNSSLDKEEVELQKRLKEVDARVKEVKDEIAQKRHVIKKVEEERGKYPTHNIASLNIDRSKMDPENENAAAEKRKLLYDIDDDERAMQQDGRMVIQEEDGESADAYFQRLKKIENAVDEKNKRLHEKCEEQRKELYDQIEQEEVDRRQRYEKENSSPLMTGKLPNYTEEEIDAFDIEELDFKVKTLEQRAHGGKGKLNLRTVEEYKEKLVRYEEELSKMNDVKDLKAKHEAKFVDLNSERLGEFTRSFAKIKEYVKQMYQMLTIGGNAQIEVKDVIRPFDHGVQYLVRPPKKSWKRIQNLSGGEKTLSSLALVFALHQFRPTPLYVMDEIDAALDFRNVSIIGHYVKERTKNAQFIIISLRNNMFELSDRLVGIYKVNDCTRHVVVEPAGVMHKAKPMQAAIDKVAGKCKSEPLSAQSSPNKKHMVVVDEKKKEKLKVKSVAMNGDAENADTAIKGAMSADLINGVSREGSVASERVEKVIRKRASVNSLSPDSKPRAPKRATGQ